MDTRQTDTEMLKEAVMWKARQEYPAADSEKLSLISDDHLRHLRSVPADVGPLMNEYKAHLNDVSTDKPKAEVKATPKGERPYPLPDPTGNAAAVCRLREAEAAAAEIAANYGKGRGR